MNVRPAANEGIRCRHAIIAIGADGICAGRGQRRVERIDPQDFPEDSGEILAVAGYRVVTVANIVRVAAVANEI